jgi:hypothetical protein
MPSFFEKVAYGWLSRITPYTPYELWQVDDFGNIVPANETQARVSLR